MSASHHGIAKRCPTCFALLADGELCQKPICLTRRKVVAASALGQAAEMKAAANARVRAARARPVQDTIAARLEPGDAPVAMTVTPMMRRDLTRPSAEVRAAFVAHLDAILTEAFATDPTENNEVLREFAEWKTYVAPDPLTLNATCIACQGTCCLQGGATFGFTTAQSMSFQRLMNPEMTQDEMRERYLADLPEQSVFKSCPFHGALGCTLPRERRAKICNEWQCTARQNFIATLNETGARYSVVVAMDAEHYQEPHPGADVFRAVGVSPEQGLVFYDDVSLPALPPDPGAP